jgi:hypothetical protein
MLAIEANDERLIGRGYIAKALDGVVPAGATPSSSHRGANEQVADQNPFYTRVGSTDASKMVRSGGASSASANIAMAR